MGDDSRWWWPDGTGLGYWPEQSPREETLNAFVAAYNVVGYEPCLDGQLEAGYDKIAIYVNAQGKPTHATRQLPSGKWTSKLGEAEDIEHDVTEGVAGEIYGESIRAVVVGNRIGKGQTPGLLVGIEAIARHVVDLDTGDGDVAIEGRRVRFRPAVKPVDITGCCGFVAVDRKILDRHI